MKTWITGLLFFSVSVLYAQQVSNFSLENVLNNQAVSPATFPSCDGLVIIFTSNSCPYDEYYRSRIVKLAQAYNTRVPFLLVNSGTDAAENKENMLKKAKDANITIPYLADKDQSLMANLDAKKSPEVFLLKNVNGKFTVVYRGAIDDNPQVQADVRQHYLKDAIDIMLNNKKIETAEVRPAGCTLKKKG
jgi:hypothetical protein